MKLLIMSVISAVVLTIAIVVLNIQISLDTFNAVAITFACGAVFGIYYFEC